MIRRRKRRDPEPSLMFPSARMAEAFDPAVSGIIGVLFLLFPA